MRPLKNKVSITLDNDVVTAIKKLAENDDRSFSQYINMILREHVAMSETAATSVNAAAVVNAAAATNLTTITKAAPKSTTVTKAAPVKPLTTVNGSQTANKSTCTGSVKKTN